MRRLLVLSALLISRNASANQCAALQRFVATPELPLGCPLVVYQDHEWHGGMVPGLWIDRGGTYSDLTPAAVTTEAETLSVYMETIDESCVEFHGYEDRVWDRMTMDLGASVQVGDVVNANYAYPAATITAAGPCPMPAPPDNLTCTDPVQDYWACEQDDMPPGDEVHPPGDGDGDGGYFGGGCNTGGGSLSFAGIALLLGLRRRRVTCRR